MTTYIGRLGDMIDVGCVTRAPAQHEQRVVFGGGAGTLAPVRARVYGAGARSWQVSRDVLEFADTAALESLARAQARWGGSYRVLPCDALDHNMFTPQASDDLVGWTNLTQGWRAAYPALDWNRGAIIPVQIPFVIGDQGANGQQVGVVAASTTAVSPLVPLVKAGTTYPKVYLSGSGTFRARVRDAAGSTLHLPTQAYSTTANVFTGVPLEQAVTADAVSVALEVVATTETYVAWPQVAYAPGPYVVGRGIDEAWVSLPSRDVIGTWGRGMESVAYEIREVGV